jgi:BTB/POZ domain
VIVSFSLLETHSRLVMIFFACMCLLFLFTKGYSGAERLADMYVYEFETQHWSRVDCTAGDAPSGRSSMVAQAHEGSLWIFGGYNGSTVLNDFYKFRLSSICIPPTRLVSDFRRLLRNASDFASDVTFRVEGKAVPAHRAILAIRSEYFRVLLCGGYMRESSSYQISSRDNDVQDSNQNDGAKPSATTTTDSLESSSASGSARDDKSSEKKKASATSDSAIVAGEIEIQDVSYEVFLMVLEFLYTDTVVELTSSSSSSSLDLGIHLLIASERFMLDRLKALCEDVIRKQVHVDNVMAILVASHVYNAKSLKDLTLDFILRHLPHPAVMNGLSDLRSEPDLLLEIIKRNSGNQGNSNNSQNHQRQYSHQYHPHEHSQSHRQQHQYENYNNHSPTSLSRYHHQAYHNDTASAANAGAGGVAAAAVAMNNIRAGGVNDNSFSFDNGIGGGDARQQQDFSSTRSSVLGPFGSEWSRR